MKRIILLTFVVSLVLNSCSDDEPQGKEYIFDIQNIVNMTDKTPEEVKSSFIGDFNREEVTLGLVTLKYDLPTKEAKYSITFKFDSDGKMNNAKAIANIDKSYSESINYFKSEMDKIHSIYNDKFYYGMYYGNSSSYPSRFEDRDDFWKYVAEKSGFKTITETWLLLHAEKINDKLVYHNLDCMYIKDSNLISIEVEKNVY